MIKQKLIKQFIVASGSKVNLKKFSTDWTGTKEAKKLGKDKIKQRSLKILEKNREELAQVQELIYASNTHSVLLIFQAMDAAGKDGTIRHVMSGVNPQGCQVFSFKPADIIRQLNLLRPIYSKTTNYGHFGKIGDPDITWEQTDKAAALRKAAK